MRSTANNYTAEKAHIGVIGSHSALAMGMAAKAFGAKTLLVVEKGRDALYAREHTHLYDHIITLEKFKDILKSGEIRLSPPMKEEIHKGEYLELPRLVMNFNMRDYGRLCEMIHIINKD